MVHQGGFTLVRKYIHHVFARTVLQTASEISCVATKRFSTTL